MPRLQGCFEMPRQEATRPRNIICGFTPSYMDRPMTAATKRRNKLENAAGCSRMLAMPPVVKQLEAGQ